jgi:thiamine-monophosphate kinase
MPRMALPFGDDVAAVDMDDNEVAVLKSDMFVELTDAPPQMTPRQMGRKAIVVTVSDFASKGVKPVALLTSVGVPRDFSRRKLKELALGMEAGAREYGVYIIGGDTDETSNLVVDCLGFGLAKKGGIVPRSGAKPGDILAVTGLFGEEPAGLKILLNKTAVPSYLRRQLVRSVLFPKAQLKLGLALARSGVVTSSIDSSDGLAWSLHELSKMSHVGFVVNTLPASPSAKRFADITGLDLSKLVLNGGEEFELVITIGPDGWNNAEASARKVGAKLYRIGETTEDKHVLLRTSAERESEIEPVGWEHFKSSR